MAPAKDCFRFSPGAYDASDAVAIDVQGAPIGLGVPDRFLERTSDMVSRGPGSLLMIAWSLASATPVSISGTAAGRAFHSTLDAPFNLPPAQSANGSGRAGGASP